MRHWDINYFGYDCFSLRRPKIYESFKIVTRFWMENSKYRLNEWLISRLQECFRGYAKLYLKQDGKIILLNKRQMYVNLFNLQFPSVQTFNINCFLHALFRDLTNLMTRERQVDKVKVCSEPDFSPSVHRQAGLWTWQTPLPVWGRSHTGTRCHVYVLSGT